MKLKKLKIFLDKNLIFFVSLNHILKLKTYLIMKKIYLLAFTLGAFSLSGFAQIELQDNFDSYSQGDVSPQAAHWRTWGVPTAPGEDATVTSDQSNSPSNSLLIGGNELTDMILLTPSAPSNGIYTIQYYAYIPTGKSGYFNMQAAVSPSNSDWNQALMGGNVYFNCDGSTAGTGGVTGVIDCSTFDQIFTYPESQWFKVTCIYDINNQVWDMKINDQEAISAQPMEFGAMVFDQLAGLDFYSATANNELYIDDVTMAVGILSTENFEADVFSVYPNPVKDVLNINSKVAVDHVIIYDVLGKVVLQENPGTISPVINMSNLPTGSYLVKVKIGNNSKTVQVLK